MFLIHGCLSTAAPVTVGAIPPPQYTEKPPIYSQYPVTQQPIQTPVTQRVSLTINQMENLNILVSFQTSDSKEKRLFRSVTAPHCHLVTDMLTSSPALFTGSSLLCPQGVFHSYELEGNISLASPQGRKAYASGDVGGGERKMRTALRLNILSIGVGIAGYVFFNFVAPPVAVIIPAIFRAFNANNTLTMT